MQWPVFASLPAARSSQWHFVQWLATSLATSALVTALPSDLLTELCRCGRRDFAAATAPAEEGVGIAISDRLSGPMTTLVGAVHAAGAEAVSTVDAAGKEIFKYNGPARPSQDWAVMRDLAIKVWGQLLR